VGTESVSRQTTGRSLLAGPQLMLLDQICQLPLLSQHRQKRADELIVIVSTPTVVHLRKINRSVPQEHAKAPV